MSSEKVYTITQSQMDILTTTIKAIYKTKKRKRDQPSEPPAKDEAPWVCAGHVWTDPPGPCQPGKRSNIQLHIMHNNKRVTVCKECKLARDRGKRARSKKKAKEAEIN